MGELHLDIIIDRLRREFKVDCNVGKPQVAYRETIGQMVEQEHKYAKQTGGRGQYGHVSPAHRAEEAGRRFRICRRDQGRRRAPKEYIPAVEKGVKEAMESGVVAGYPVVDVKVALF